MRLPARLAVAIPIFVLTGCAILQLARSSYAGMLAGRDTVAALSAASRIVPGNADYHARIATLDASNDGELRTALRLNPADASLWITRSIRQEEDGDVAGAEQSLLHANAVCQYYTPRWSLAAFYYRQERKPEFMKWARLALSAGTGAPGPLFVMAQRLEIPASQALRDMIPADPRVINAYLYFLLERGDLEAAYAAASRLAETGSDKDRGGLLDTTGALFAGGRMADAVALWNRAVRAGWVALSTLDPAAGKSLASGHFGERPGGGFDWTYSLPEGVAVSRSETGGALCLEFSGRQPESCDLLSQPVPLLAGRNYKLTIHYRTPGIPAGSGMRWSVMPVAGGRPIYAGPLNSSEESSQQTFSFETPAQETPLKIVFSYTRATGSTRVEGKLWIEGVELTLVP